jgi:hypothetical protein
MKRHYIKLFQNIISLKYKSEMHTMKKVK